MTLPALRCASRRPIHQPALRRGIRNDHLITDTPWDEKKLKRLKAAVRRECDRRIKQNHKLAVNDVVHWLLANQQPLVSAALEEIVYEQVEERNDDRTVERVLRQRPEMRHCLKPMRENSEILDVPTWYLLA